MNSDEFFLRAVRRLRMLMRDSRMGSSSGGMADMLLDTPAIADYQSSIR